MQNFYGNSGKGAKTVCGISDDDDADDYENVIDNRKVPAVPERLKTGRKTTSKKQNLQLKYMDKPANSVDRSGNTTHGPRTVPPFQPPAIGLDFTSPAVNAAFTDQTVQQTSEKMRKWDWKMMVLIFYLVLMFLYSILLTSFMFIYYSNISNQLSDLKKNASQVQDSTKKEREAWKEDLMKVNQTLVSEIAILKSDVKSIQAVLHLGGFTERMQQNGFLPPHPEKQKGTGKGLFTSRFSCMFSLYSGDVCVERKGMIYAAACQKVAYDALRPSIGNKRFWIGLRRDNRNTWRWVDGTIPVYTNWNSGEPNNAAQREHCTEMIAGGWNDLDCSKTIDYICRKSPTC